MTIYSTVPALLKSEIPAWEQSPFVLNGDLYRAGFRRSWSATVGQSVVIEKYLPMLDTWTRVADIPWNRYLGSAFCENGQLFIFGVTDVANSPNSIVRQEIDTATWTLLGPESTVRTSSGGFKFFNTSVCRGPSTYIMAYETDEATPFSFRFLRSSDLLNWTPIGGLCNAGFYSACPTVRYGKNGYYIVSYLFDQSGNGHGPWITAMARTNNFAVIENFAGNAQYTCYQQLMAPDAEMDGINASDVDFVQWDDKVYFTYLTGDQKLWAGNNDAWYNGTIENLYEEFWPT